MIRKLGQRLPRNELQDLLFERNANGNNAMMACALRDGHEVLAQFLFMILTKGNSLTGDRINDLLHLRNKQDNTLLSLTLQHKGTTTIPLQLLLKMEKDHHNNKLCELTKCFKKNLNPSLEVWQALSEIEESYPKDNFKKLMIWISTFFFALVWPSSVLAFDVGSDYNLLEDYHPDSVNSSSTYLFACNRYLERSNSTCANRKQEFANHGFKDLCELPQKLPQESRFYYLLAFILMPHFFYSLEFIQTVEFNEMWVNLNSVSVPGTKKSHLDKPKKMLAFLFYLFLSFLKLILWPFYMIWKSFISEGRTATSSGQNYFRLTRKKDENLILEARSRIIEACTEASFQPMLVLYMALPDIITIFTHADEGPDCEPLTGVRKIQNITSQLMINPQIISIFASIVSLVMSFDMYYKAQKRGALGMAGNFYARLIRLGSTLLLVVRTLFYRYF